LSDGTRKVTSISEITGVEGDIISMQEIFTFRKTGLAENGTVLGEFVATGIRPRLSERLAASGVNLPPSMFESSRLH
jgi:pilus assembly protein CpaF